LQRINTPDARYHDGNPATGELGTIVPAACLNAVQEEIAQAIEGFGGTVNAGIANQLFLAIQAAINAAATQPAGSIMPYGGAAAPAGWLLCNGQAVSRTTYATLFGVVGVAFGPGNNVDTFNLPDLRGRMPIGAGQGAGLSDRVRGAKAGEESHVLTVPEIPGHSHTFDAVDGAHATPGGTNWVIPAFIPGNKHTTDPTGDGQPHNNMQPYQVVNYIIKT
jgi:microcystin-dependent protein